MANKFLNSIISPTAEKIEIEKQYVTEKIKSIGEETLKKLAGEAVKVRQNAYQPYSKYSVGAAILCSSGKIYSAPNTEVVTYSQTGHAEHNAINKAISEGEGKDNKNFIEAVVVSSESSSEPCGACRQEIAEHSENAVIIAVDANGNPTATTSLKVLLPLAFTPKDLGF